MPNQQPEPKQYPTRDHPGFCPFSPKDHSSHAGNSIEHRPPCDPAGCQLGDSDTGQCAIWQIQDRLVWMETIAHALQALQPPQTT